MWPFLFEYEFKITIRDFYEGLFFGIILEVFEGSTRYQLQPRNKDFLPDDRKNPYLVPGTTIVKKNFFEGSTRYQMQLQNFSKIF